MVRILAINPGSISTKVAYCEDEKKVWAESLYHDIDELLAFTNIIDQLDYRISCIRQLLLDKQVDALDVVVSRGGLLKPVSSGVYGINDELLMDSRRGVQGQHAANLGALIAVNIAQNYGAPAYIVDPVSVDELTEVAKLSGMPGIERRSLAHALGLKGAAKKAAKMRGTTYEESNMVVCLLGSGISVTAHLKGQMIDVNDANSQGPYSPERAGGLPAVALVKLCFSGDYSEQELISKLTRKSGLYGYLGTKDLRDALEMSRGGDEKATLALNGMVYQIAKEIGGMAAALAGDVDCIVLSGSMAQSGWLVGEITKRVRFIAPVVTVTGDIEMEAMVRGALDVINSRTTPKIYPAR